MQENLRILLADDHEMLRAGVKHILEQHEHLTVVAEASSGEQAYELYSKLMPDLLIMDMSMPGMGGLEAIRRIKTRDHNAKVIIFSMHEEALYAIQALSSGAVGYVLKSAELGDLLQAIKQAMLGKSFMSAAIAQKIALKSLAGEYSSIEQLTAREFEVFCLLAEGKKVSEISDLLMISQKTVATYQTRIKKKLNIDSAVDLVRLAVQYGIVS
ncbi:two component LuxR family transcriptional regulator [Methylophaga lonarensis MPL]|uniref:Two component LuxR family transcriptional regulator n=1 Tax=Methylophaga lonarensis MPL TaxID=1286106 RepID=M7PNP7_9GAMM|nr:response regulator transcription factor [Methylophaga lonarensis]EMR12099.1 two component LuxR family transcriptional regulator [Methylophaga lonarensis MPL]